MCWGFERSIRLTQLTQKASPRWTCFGEDTTNLTILRYLTSLLFLDPKAPVKAGELDFIERCFCMTRSQIRDLQDL